MSVGEVRLPYIMSVKSGSELCEGGSIICAMYMVGDKHKPKLVDELVNANDGLVATCLIDPTGTAYGAVQTKHAVGAYSPCQLRPVLGAFTNLGKFS